MASVNGFIITTQHFDSSCCRSGVRLRKFFDKKCKERNLRLREEDIKLPDAKKKRISS